jgi:chemotaxis protein CheY-P-specific phosphatase CheC
MQTSAVSEVINKLKSVLILRALAASCWLKLHMSTPSLLTLHIYDYDTVSFGKFKSRVLSAQRTELISRLL